MVRPAFSKKMKPKCDWWKRKQMIIGKSVKRSAKRRQMEREGYIVVRYEKPA